MADDPTKTAEDRQRISLKQDHEVRQWCESLKCTPDELARAVAAVGNSAEAVRAHLQKIH